MATHWTEPLCRGYISMLTHEQCTTILGNVERWSGERHHVMLPTCSINYCYVCVSMSSLRELTPIRNKIWVVCSTSLLFMNCSVIQVSIGNTISHSKLQDSQTFRVTTRTDKLMADTFQALINPNYTITINSLDLPDLGSILQSHPATKFTTPEPHATYIIIHGHIFAVAGNSVSPALEASDSSHTAATNTQMCQLCRVWTRNSDNDNLILDGIVCNDETMARFTVISTYMQAV